MYYKIVTERSFFTDWCADQNVDVFNIPSGTVFQAPEHSKYKPNNPFCLLGENCFHFAEGAFDMMMWHDLRLGWRVKQCVIYEIEPIDEVKKERCKDHEGFYQCAANKIKVLGKQKIGDMYDLAVAEYAKDPNRYTNIKFDVNDWRKHRSTVFSLLRDYYDRY